MTEFISAWFAIICALAGGVLIGVLITFACLRSPIREVKNARGGYIR